MNLRLGATIRAYNNPNRHGILLAAHNFSNGFPSGIDVSFDDSNNLTTKAHTPSSATNNSTEIATTAWVYNHEAVAVDGQWVIISYTIASDISATSSYSNTFTIPTSAIPDDGYEHEILIQAQGKTGTTSGNTCFFYVGTTAMTNPTLMFIAQTRSSNSVYGAGTSIIPIGTDRKITISCSNQTGTSNIDLYMHAYRRIGTNP